MGRVEFSINDPNTNGYLGFYGKIKLESFSPLHTKSIPIISKT
jgi:hypothetical protein